MRIIMKKSQDLNEFVWASISGEYVPEELSTDMIEGLTEIIECHVEWLVLLTAFFL